MCVESYSTRRIVNFWSSSQLIDWKHELFTNNTIADEVIDLLEPQVREMLRILHIPNNKDVEMRKLIFRLGETSK